MNKKILVPIQTRRVKWSAISCMIVLMTLAIAAMMTQTSCMSMHERTQLRTSSDETYIGALSDLGHILGGLWFGESGYILLGLVDLPFSFVFDTLLLPTDLLAGPGALIGQCGLFRGRQFTMRIVDEAGLPLRDAYVRVFNKERAENWSADNDTRSGYPAGQMVAAGWSDRDGVFAGKRPTRGDMRWTAKKAGYYNSIGAQWDDALTVVMNRIGLFGCLVLAIAQKRNWPYLIGVVLCLIAIWRMLALEYLKSLGW